MDLALGSLILTIILTSVVAGFVYGRNPKSDITRSFLLLITGFVLWALGEAFFYASTDLKVLFIADQLTYLFGLGTAWALLLFAIRFAFPWKANNFFLILFSLLTIIAAVLVFYPNAILVSVYSTPGGGREIIHSNLFLLYMLPVLVLFIYSYVILWKKYVNAVGDMRLLIKYVIISSLVPVIAGSILSLGLLYFGIDQYQVYGPIFTLFFTFSVAYLLVRSRN